MRLRHVGFNLVGLGAPLVVAVFTIPILIAQLGTDRFGLLALIWAVVSYFGMLDLGLGRALTQQLAVVLAQGRHDKVGPLIGTALALMAALGVVAGVAMAAGAEAGVALIRLVPDRSETVGAVYAMAFAMPAIVLTSGLRGILEARHAFGIINLIRLPMGLFTFLGPLIVVAWFEPRLDTITWVLAVGRVLACVAHAWFAYRVVGVPRSAIGVDPSLLRPLCAAGGWMSVSNVVSPLMSYVDRFVVAAIVSASAVAYYTTPQEVMTKLWIIPGALTAVLFPAMAAQIARGEEATVATMQTAVRWLFVVMLPLSTALALFAPELLSAWIDAEFSRQSAPLMRIFAIGMFVTCLAQIPFTAIQSAGHAHLTAVLHAIELPLFLVMLWWLVSAFGVEGAACAWLLRVLVDAVAMASLSNVALHRPAFQLSQAPVGAFALSVLGFAGAWLPGTDLRLMWLLLTLGAVALLMRSRRRLAKPIVET